MENAAQQSHEAPPAPDAQPRPAPAAPQLRTILLTDLADSTGLVERLGDTEVSGLFRAHDRLVLQLQQQWRGRLIDRSDGLLLLFERPIDGLGFALDYARGLAELAAERKLDLRARAGLHVGEVLTWRNSDEAVSLGAKPLEVEGLAKPMAARLMAMARPGQILLSAVAEPLAHRAARELGDRGAHLLWKSWGRWRFKGVPEPQQIFEVGEPGVAPLRVPPNTPKAWRDIPLWRRPAALAAELALVIGAGLVLWTLTRPAPAIAFNQRDWVVVGDLRNLTGQVALDDSLEQAFRISLEQSRHVNVLSDLKARDTLARMQRPPNTVLDRAIASEIALRDGARAVILPTVAEIGGRVRVSAEVVDPNTQTTIYAETADGKGVESVLESIDTVTASLRGKLGEAVKSIEQDSAPLPEVTTKNLDALRAYALGQKSYGRNDYGEALRFYARATELDPEFALAWLGQTRAHYSQMRAPAALEPLRKATALRSHLAPREAMYLDAWAAEFDQPDKVVDKWEQLTQLYPDYKPAQGNAAIAMFRQNRFVEALPHAKLAAVPQYELAAKNADIVGRIQLGLESYGDASATFDHALAQGGGSLRRRLAVDAAQRNYATANKMAKQLSLDDPHAYLERTTLAIDQAQWRDAKQLAEAGLAKVERDGGFDGRGFLMPLAVASWLSGDSTSANEHVRSAANQAIGALAQPHDPDAIDDIELALAAAIFGQRLGNHALGRRVIESVEGHPMLRAMPGLAELATVLRAEEARREGEAERAISLLEPLLSGHERYQTRVALMQAYKTAGRLDSALEQARWLQRRRGLAYVELTCSNCMQALNVADSNIAALTEAEILNKSERRAEARRVLDSIEAAWPPARLPNHLRVRR